MCRDLSELCTYMLEMRVCMETRKKSEQETMVNIAEPHASVLPSMTDKQYTPVTSTLHV